MNAVSEKSSSVALEPPLPVGLAAPAGASPVRDTSGRPGLPGRHVTPAAGITGTDPAMLEDGYSVCRRLWVRQMPGTQIAAGLVQDHPQLTTDQAGQFVLAAYHGLCPVPGGTYDYWAYSTRLRMPVGHRKPYYARPRIRVGGYER